MAKPQLVPPKQNLPMCAEPGCENFADQVQTIDGKPRATCHAHAKDLAIATKPQERTLADLRRELWEGNNELFNEFFASIAEQSELTPEQSELLSGYLDGEVAKRDKLADFIKALEEEAARLREREKSLADRRHEFESIAGMFRSSILAHMTNNPLGIVKRVDGFESSFRVKKNPDKVEIFSEAEIPGEFINYEPVPDKAAIKGVLQSGKEVPGARIADTTYHLELK